MTILQDPDGHARAAQELDVWHKAEQARLSRAISLCKTSGERATARQAQAALEVEYRKRLKDMRGRFF